MIVRSDSPYITDWYVVSLRWVIILGATTSLSIASALITPGGLLLLVMVVWNMLLSWLAGQSRRFKYHRAVCSGVDYVIAALFFLGAGGLMGPAAWVLIMPLISTGLYFNLRGGVISALLVSPIELADIYFHNTNLIFTIVCVVITFALGGLFGYISQQTYNQLQMERRKQIALREKKQIRDTERLRTIYTLSSTLTSTLSYERVLDAALDMGVDALRVGDVDADGNSTVPPDAFFTSAVLLFQGDLLVVGSARRFTQNDMRAIFPAKQGILAKVIEEGEPLVTGNLSNDPELGSVVAFSGCNSIYCLPMRSGLNIYGALIFGHSSPGYFNQERCEVLGIIGRQAVVAIQNARLYQDLANEKERIMEVQEEARKKLARDLHDGPTQSVSAIAMRVSLANRMMDRNPKAASEELIKIEDLARRTTKEIRHMLFTLRPLVLESQGLAAALHANAEKIKETYNQDVVIQVDEKYLDEIEMGKSGVIFYIVEEAVNNARKHAKASQIIVRLYPLPQNKDIAVLEIADNGVGFDIAEVNKSYDKRGSLGMVNLRERTELVNGVLNIQSAPGKGTKIQVVIPLTEEAADMLNNLRSAQQKQAAR